LSACGAAQTPAGQAPFVINAPSVLPEAGQAHFKKRVDEISAKTPITRGTVLIGDSITEAWMWQQDAEAYPFQKPVRNHGVGWDTTEGAVTRLQMVEPSIPDQIFIKIGTNDISWGVPLQEMEMQFNLLLSRLGEQEPQAELFVQSVLPREADKLGKIAQVNAMQAKVARSHKVTYIDLTSIFAQSDGTLRADLTDDGLHLNAAGYAIWGEALLPYVE